MKRFQSILSASLLTVALSSTAFAGNITTLSAGNITTTPGNITTKPGNITTLGNITTWSVIESIITLVRVIG